ncbi:MAG: hypothetical protein GX066_09090 [Clostridiaceae bacterium]|nr:hypothetical protein [Clostridiaceae bacterium]
MKRAFDIRGHTLLEVVLTLLIIGILLFMAVYHIQMDQDVLMRKCANKLISDIRYVQMKAIYEKNDRYRLYVSYGQYSDYYRVQCDTNVLYTVRLDKGITYKSNYEGNYLSFSPTGAPNRAGTFTFRNRKGNTLEVTVSVATGRARIVTGQNR